MSITRNKNKVDFKQLTYTATNRWPELLATLGIELPNNGKHGPCPVCGGKDRFRLDDKDGRGTYYCNQHGAGDGLKLISECFSISILDAARRLKELLGGNFHELPSMRDFKAEQTKKEKLKLQKQRDIALHCGQQWQQAGPANPDHGYLQQKQILPVGDIRQAKGALLIPLTYRSELYNLQHIYPKTKKYKNNKFFAFEKGNRKQGCMFLIGEPVAPYFAIFVAEGYATAATIYMATGCCTCVCFDCNNIEQVVIQLLEITTVIVICADNDTHQETNPGYNKALKVADKYKLGFCAPEFADDEEGTDFNDLHNLEGLPYVKGLFQSCYRELLHECA